MLRDPEVARLLELSAKRESGEITDSEREELRRITEPARAMPGDVLSEHHGAGDH